MAKKVIWTSEINMEDWKEFLEEEYPEIEDENEQYNLVRDYMVSNLEDKRDNLDIPTEGQILIIADLGLWNGRHTGYKFVDRKNINAILQSDCDDVEWYCDGYNIKATAYHHDGTNHYEYREVRAGKEDSIYKLLNRLYNGEKVDRKMINYYTKSIAPQVKAVYGW